MFQGVGNFGLWMFSRGCGPDAGRCRDTIRVDWGRDCSRQAPTRAPTQVGVDAGQVRGRAEGLVRYGESGLRVVTKPIASPVANIADR